MVEGERDIVVIAPHRVIPIQQGLKLDLCLNRVFSIKAS